MKIWKRLLIFGGGLLIAGLLLKILGQFLVSEEWLEGVVEENLNCEAGIESVEVLWLKKALRVKKAELRHREEVGGQPAMEVRELELSLKLLPLFGRKLEVDGLVLREPVVRMEIDGEGEISLKRLLESPEESSGSSEGAGGDLEKRKGALEARDHSWLARLNRPRVEGGRVFVALTEHHLDVEVSDLEVEIAELEFDPERLESLNHAVMSLAGEMELFDVNRHKLVVLDVAGEVRGRLFDPESGAFNADVAADLSLGKRSHVDPGIKLVRMVWELLHRVERVGIDLGDLPDEIGFGRSERLKGSYREGVVTLLAPLSLTAGGWELGLAGESWIETHSGEHGIGIEFFAGDRTSGMLSGWLSQLPKEVRTIAENRFLDESKVLWRVESRGNLEDPQLNFFSQLPEAGDLLKDVEETLNDELKNLRKEAGGLLRSLFGGEEE